jgi:hypothetical protein
MITTFTTGEISYGQRGAASADESPGPWLAAPIHLAADLTPAKKADDDWDEEEEEDDDFFDDDEEDDEDDEFFDDDEEEDDDEEDLEVEDSIRLRPDLHRRPRR